MSAQSRGLAAVLADVVSHEGRSAAADRAIIQAVFLPLLPRSAASQFSPNWFSVREHQELGLLAPRRRPCWLASRVALKLAGRQAGGRVPLDAIEVTHFPDGRPRVLALPGWHCSLAHARGAGLAAVSRHPVGVDLEPLTRFDLEFSRRIATDEEIALLPAAAARCPSHAAALLWTIKEAVLKAVGCGLGLHPRAVRVLGRVGRDWVLRLPPRGALAPIWRVRAIMRRGFCLAVARPKAAGRVHLHLTDGAQLAAGVEG